MKNRFKRLLIVIAVLIAGVLAVAGGVVIDGFVTAPAALRRAYEHPLPLKLADLTPEQRQVLLTVQDPNFYSHSGADFSLSGGVWTTITEALVKQLYFKDFEPGFLHLGKVRQILLAVGFNCRVSKDEQLRLFINRIYLGEIAGRPFYGFEDASHVYFGKPFADLSREEYLSLVATLASPSKLNPRRHRAENKDRVGRIERLLRGECAPLGKTDAFLVNCFN